MLFPLAANTRAWLIVGGILFAIAAALFVIDRVFAWIGKNGARAMRNDRAAGGMSGFLNTFEGLLRPEKQLVEEEREQRMADIGQTDPSRR